MNSYKSEIKFLNGKLLIRVKVRCLVKNLTISLDKIIKINKVLLYNSNKKYNRI